MELANFSSKLKNLQNQIKNFSLHFEYPDDEEKELKEEEMLDSESENLKKKDLPDYSAYAVDSTVPHSLYEDYRFTKACAFSINGQYYPAKNMRDVLVQTCSILAKMDINKLNSFVDDPTLKGRKVSYFGTKLVIEDSTQKNERIPGTDIYVWVNLSCNHIRNILRKILKKYGINFNQYKIYLRADFSKLHNKSVSKK